MIKLLSAIICTGFFSVSVNAANWIDIGKSIGNKTQMFIDADSIKPYKINSYSRDEYVSAFVQHTYINNHPNRKAGKYYTKILTIADCNKRSTGSVAFIEYGFKDEVISSYQDKNFTASDLNIVFPDTMGESILEIMCY